MSSNNPFDEVRQARKDSDDTLKKLLLEQNYKEFWKELDNHSLIYLNKHRIAYSLYVEALDNYCLAKYELAKMKERNAETSKITEQEALVTQLKKVSDKLKAEKKLFEQYKVLYHFQSEIESIILDWSRELFIEQQQPNLEDGEAVEILQGCKSILVQHGAFFSKAKSLGKTQFTQQQVLYLTNFKKFYLCFLDIDFISPKLTLDKPELNEAGKKFLLEAGISEHETDLLVRMAGLLEKRTKEKKNLATGIKLNARK